MIAACSLRTNQRNFQLFRLLYMCVCVCVCVCLLRNNAVQFLYENDYRYLNKTKKATNRQMWRLKTSSWWITDKLIDMFTSVVYTSSPTV